MARPMAPPRVVIATRQYPPETSAAGFRIEALARGLARAGAEVTVVTTRPPRGTVIPPAEERIHVRRWPVLRDRGGNVRGYLPYASFDVPALFRLLVTRADAIVAEAPPMTGFAGLIASRIRRAPLIYYPGDVWTDALLAMEVSSPVVRFARWLEARVLRGAERSIAVSGEVGERMIALGAHSEAVVTVGNGIDTEVFRPDVAPVVEPEPFFAYTGTMSEWQRPEIFVEALARLDDREATIVFLGQGTAEPQIRDAAARLVPGRVRFEGVVPAREAAAWLRGAVGALVSIVPGIGYDFARPTKTYAAAAVGTPVLYTGAPAGAEPVRQGGLGEVAAFDADEIAAAMRRLLDAHRAGDTAAERGRRAAWAEVNVSLRGIGDRAAAVVLSAIAARRDPGARKSTGERERGTS